MGRHSDPDPRWFWLSLAAAVGKALAVVLLLAGAVFGATRLFGSADGGGVAVRLTEPAETASTADASETAEPEPTEETEEPTERASVDTTFEDASENDADDDADDVGDEAAVRGTVQVLNASGDAGVLRDVIAALEELGWQVVAEGRASRAYARTTVFWSEGHEDDAEALRDADERFAVIQSNDRLDPTIDLHVVVGRDWEPSEPAD